MYCHSAFGFASQHERFCVLHMFWALRVRFFFSHLIVVLNLPKVWEEDRTHIGCVFDGSGQTLHAYFRRWLK